MNEEDTIIHVYAMLIRTFKISPPTGDLLSHLLQLLLLADEIHNDKTN